MCFYVCQNLFFLKNNDSRTSMSNAQPMVIRIIKKLLQIKKKKCIMYRYLYVLSKQQL